MLNRFLSTAFVLILLSGCVSNPTTQEMAAADYGAYPENYEQLIGDFLDQALKDPYSAKIQFINEPKKTYRKTGNFAQGREYGYLVCADINAKNVMGAYTGTTLHHFFIQNNRLTYHEADKYLTNRQWCF